MHKEASILLYIQKCCESKILSDNQSITIYFFSLFSAVANEITERFFPYHWVLKGLHIAKAKYMWFKQIRSVYHLSSLIMLQYSQGPAFIPYSFILIITTQPISWWHVGTCLTACCKLWITGKHNRSKDVF